MQLRTAFDYSSDIGASKGKLPFISSNRFISDAACAGVDQIMSLLRIGGKMQRGKKNLPWFKPFAFGGLGLLDLGN